MVSFELHPDFEGRKITTLVRHFPQLDPQADNFAKITTPKSTDGVDSADDATAAAKNNHAATAATESATTQNTAAPKSALPQMSQTTPKSSTSSAHKSAHKSEPHKEIPPRFVFLAIHGWNDYFYQVELARAISALGGRFYAIDLAKYGRSHLPEQTWGYTTDLSAYDEDLHAARDAIYSEVPQGTPFILYGHSTGGLTAALWADRHPGALAGLVLNSPWIEIQAPTAVRQAIQPAIEALSHRDPTAVLPIPDEGFYQRTLTGNHLDDPTIDSEPNPEADPFFTDGWRPDPRYRHFPSMPVRAGWINAILSGHEKVASGLHLDIPVLTLTSKRSYSGSSEWNNDRLATDSVLRVDQIWKRCLNLSNSLTLEKIPNAIHDVTLSRYSARARAFAVIRKWLDSVLPEQPKPLEQSASSVSFVDIHESPEK